MGHCWTVAEVETLRNYVSGEYMVTLHGRRISLVSLPPEEKKQRQYGGFFHLGNSSEYYLNNHLPSDFEVARVISFDWHKQVKQAIQ